jgi:hypothetical protein
VPGLYEVAIDDEPSLVTFDATLALARLADSRGIDLLT